MRTAPVPRRPLLGLAVLFTAAFTTITTETLPTGPLPVMSHALVDNTSGSAAATQPETQTVRASVDLAAHRWNSAGVRGATRPIAPPPMTLSATLRLSHAQLG
ncbi:hypothetical protein ACFWFK_00555 [Micromonospora chalcea]